MASVAWSAKQSFILFVILYLYYMSFKILSNKTYQFEQHMIEKH